jgi:LuxR family maltose regulon positive regulatory protein
MHASGGLAAIECELGDVTSARARAADATAVAEEHDLTEHWAYSLSLAARGQLLEMQGDLDGAEALLVRATQLARRGIASIEIAYSLLALAGVRQRLGRAAEARRVHGEARDAIRACEDPGILGERMTRAERRLRFAGPVRGLRVQNGGEALSDAELSVLRLLRSQLSQREIAAELQLSFNTIKTHTRNIYRKLDVAERAQAVARAREWSLI